MDGAYQDREKAEILKPLLDAQLPIVILGFLDGDDDGDDPIWRWKSDEYPVAHEKLARLFQQEYGEAAVQVADAYICGFMRGVRAGLWDSYRPLPKRRKLVTRDA